MGSNPTGGRKARCSSDGRAGYGGWRLLPRSEIKHNTVLGVVGERYFGVVSIEVQVRLLPPGPKPGVAELGRRATKTPTAFLPQYFLPLYGCRSQAILRT